MSAVVVYTTHTGQLSAEQHAKILASIATSGVRKP